MKVLHINCNYIGTALHQVMKRKLDDIGSENLVYTPTYDKNISIIAPDSNVIVSECFRKWDRILFDYKQNKIFRDIQSKVKINSYDCIHAYTLFTDGNCAYKLSKKYNIPYVVAVRNTDVNTFFKKMIHLRKRGVNIMRNAKAIFFLSDAYKKQVFDKYVPKKYHNELLGKTHIIPNGIDDFWFKNRADDNKKRVLGKEIKLLYAGRIDKNKNIPTTQKAIEILNSKGYKCSLTVVGKVVDEKEFSAVRADKNTACLPAMSKEKLIDVYRASDIFVMPSFTETFGLVYVEAMSQGLPVVYSQGEGFDGQFIDGEVGFSVNPKSVESVAEAIENVINNYHLITKDISQKIDRFNWNKIVEQYDCIYKRIKEDVKNG